jgi:two-component system, response regulator RegA
MRPHDSSCRRLSSVTESPGRRAVIFDDDRLFSASLSALLLRQGWEPICLQPEPGVEAQVGEPPDVVVLEPCPQGAVNLQFLSSITHAWSRARVVVVTAYPSLALGVLCIRAGAHDCFSKPVSTDSILAAVIDEQRQPPSLSDALMRPSLARIEHEYISQILRETRGNISAAARLLGIRRSTLQRKLRKHPPTGSC